MILRGVRLDFHSLQARCYRLQVVETSGRVGAKRKLPISFTFWDGRAIAGSKRGAKCEFECQIPFLSFELRY